MTTNKPDSFVGGVGLGLLIGAGAFVLFGTRKGKLLQERLRTALTDVANEVDSGGLSQISPNAVEVAPLPQEQTLRQFLTSVYDLIKQDFNDLANAPAARATAEAEPKRKRVKKHTFKNTQTKK